MDFYYFVFIVCEAWCDFEIVVENEIMKKNTKLYNVIEVIQKGGSQWPDTLHCWGRKIGKTHVYWPLKIFIDLRGLFLKTPVKTFQARKANF